MTSRTAASLVTNRTVAIYHSPVDERLARRSRRAPARQHIDDSGGRLPIAEWARAIGNRAAELGIERATERLRDRGAVARHVDHRRRAQPSFLSIADVDRRKREGGRLDDGARRISQQRI